jgi:uncharacterized protein YodC (DUF2158 family)
VIFTLSTYDYQQDLKPSTITNKKMNNKNKLIAISLFVVFESLIFSNFYTRDIKKIEILFALISLVIVIVQIQVGFSSNLFFKKIGSIFNPISALYIIIYFVIIPFLIAPLFHNRYEFRRSSWFERLIDINFQRYLLSLYTTFNGLVITGLLMRRESNSSLPKNLNSKFKPGDLVILKAGGPTMVIGTVEKPNSESTINYKCSWIDGKTLQPFEAIYSEEQLNIFAN